MIMWRLLVALATIGCLAQGEEYCYSSDKNPYKLMGTKTEYSVLPHQPLTKIPDTPQNGHCRPVMLWMVGKHGVSWPSKTERDEYFSFLPNLKQRMEEMIKANSIQLCKKDQNLIKSWKPKIMEERQGLHPTGVKGVKGLAQRIKKAFPRLFKKPFTENNYIVQYGKRIWTPTYETANVFIQAIFGRQNLVDYPEIVDLVEDLQKCRKKPGESNNLNSKDNLVLQNSYEAVNQRLGLQLDANKINSIFFACAEESAWSPKSKSPWCALLRPEDIKAQEYAEDLEYYYSSAYGDDFGRDGGCPFVKDMIDRFRLYKENPTSSHPSGIFYFGFSKHVNFVTTALGMMYPKNQLPLDRMEESRNYRASNFLGYQGNLIAVLHECRTMETPTRKSYRVKFFLDEQPTEFVDVDLDDLIKDFTEYIDSSSCNHDYCFEDVSARADYRVSSPLPLGVNLAQSLDLGEKADKPFSSSEGVIKRAFKRVIGIKWYWWILIAPILMLFSFISLIRIGL